MAPPSKQTAGIVAARIVSSMGRLRAAGIVAIVLWQALAPEERAEFLRALYDGG